jgi:hypothetical protein
MQNETRSTGVKVIVYNKSAFPAAGPDRGAVPLLLHPRRRRGADRRHAVHPGLPRPDRGQAVRR